MRKLVVLIFSGLLGFPVQVYARQEFPRPIIFRHMDNPDILDFAVSEMRGERGTRSEAEWVKLVKERALYAEMDIDDDGVPELFLQLGAFCGTVGCDTSIYKRTDKAGKGSVLLGRSKRFNDICLISITGNDPQTYLLERKENGYHLIDTENGAIIHWNIKDKNGQPWCWRHDQPGG
jgi:hypothetical protein